MLCRYGWIGKTRARLEESLCTVGFLVELLGCSLIPVFEETLISDGNSESSQTFIILLGS